MGWSYLKQGLRFTSQCTMAHKPKLNYPCTESGIILTPLPWIATVFQTGNHLNISLVDFVHSVKKHIKAKGVVGYLN